MRLEAFLVYKHFLNFMAAENQARQLTQILTQKLSDNLSIESLIGSLVSCTLLRLHKTQNFGLHCIDKLCCEVFTERLQVAIYTQLHQSFHRCCSHCDSGYLLSLASHYADAIDEIERVGVLTKHEALSVWV